MLIFPNAKINLFLSVENIRQDGFHDIKSVIYPIPLYDVVEFKRAGKFDIKVFGENIPGSVYDNLLYQAWDLLHAIYNIRPVEILLLKNIPLQTGLGGGSADGAFFLKTLSAYCELDLNQKSLLKLAAELCSDCPFFIYNKPALITGKGDNVKQIPLSLKGFYLVLVFPEMKMDTKEMYSKINTVAAGKNMEQVVLSKNFDLWRKYLKNDFENVIPQKLLKVKENLYRAGALYASLTGSGSAFFGIFSGKPDFSCNYDHKIMLLP